MVGLNLSDKGLENKEEYKKVINTKDRVNRVKAIRDALYPTENIKIETDTNKKDFIKVVQGYIGKDKSGKILTETGRPLPPAVLEENGDVVERLIEITKEMEGKSQKNKAGKDRVKIL